MQKQIIAHRGAPFLAHENTIAAFQKAIELGAEIIEFDVRKTLDNILAVYHDAEIAGKLVSQMTFSALNQEAGKGGFSVPTLTESLQVIAGRAQVQIEIKDLGCELELAATAMKVLPLKSFSIISFNFESLEVIKNRYPQISLGLILGSKGKNFYKTLKFLLSRDHHLAKINFVSVNYWLWQLGFAKITPKNYDVTVWTADEPELIKSLLTDKRISAIASNKPDLALKLRDLYDKPQ